MTTHGEPQAVGVVPNTSQALYQNEGRVEIDDNAPVSRNEERKFDHGAYVQAWVWVADPEPNDSKRLGN